MSVKPGSLPRWADVGGAIVVPPSGSLDVGHVAGSQPLNSYENWYKNLVYLWTQYLSDGNLTGNHTITGSLAVSALITATGGVTAAINQHMAVSGTGAFKRGVRVRRQGTAAASWEDSALTTAVAKNSLLNQGRITFTPANNNQRLQWTIPVMQGERLTSVGVIMRADASTTFQVKVFKFSVVLGAAGTPTATQIGATSTFTGTASLFWTLVGPTGLTELGDANSDNIYEVQVTCNPVSSGAVLGCIDVTDVP